MARISDMLPGFNCGKCGLRSCAEFADKLQENGELEQCPFLSQDRFASSRKRILEALGRELVDEHIVGVIIEERADLTILPLRGEGSCREDLFPFDRSLSLGPGDVIRYRPLGCPITHFAKVISMSHGIITVHIVGPRHMMGDDLFQPQDIGICMVAAFEGTLGRGRAPQVGQTVRFLPQHCMMGKVHTGIVVSVMGDRIRIEGIDIKVWS